MDHLRYPIGLFQYEGLISHERRAGWISEIEELPEQLRQAVEGLNEETLNLSYREGGWSIRQVVHHLADSHANAFIRFRMALTEENLTVKPYDENAWGNLADNVSAPIAWSLSFLEGIHKRWVYLARALEPMNFEKTFYHPESGDFTLDKQIALYAWHGKHHVAHITSFRSRSGV